MALPDLYAGVAGHFPLSAFAQFNRLQDWNQTFFFGLTSGAPVSADEWSARMQALVAQIRGENLPASPPGPPDPPDRR